MKRPSQVFPSPRITKEDEETLIHGLRDHDERWSHMSRLAGSHKQDDTVLRVDRNSNMSPLSLQSGVPPQLASRIMELHLANVTNLPEWLDVLSTTFQNLQHLTFLDCKDDATEAGRIRRLYILYRLPHLLTMNGRPVTELERSLARPNSPNGCPVAPHDWIPHGDAVQVSLHGMVQRVPVEVFPTEKEEHVPTPDQPRQTPLVHYSKSLESAYRTVKMPSIGCATDTSNPDNVTRSNANPAPQKSLQHTMEQLRLTDRSTSLSSAFPMQCRPLVIDDSKRLRPPPVPGRPIVNITSPSKRNQWKKQIARAAQSMLDDDSTSDEGEE